MNNNLTDIIKPKINIVTLRDMILKNEDITLFDYSHITNFDALFKNRIIPKKNTLHLLDTSNITRMFEMFFNCTSFNTNISMWDVSNVTNMNSMFEGCTYFNQPLNKWDVSNVVYMKSMFHNCSDFNQPLNKWNVSNVTHMNLMFYCCTNFNKPLNKWNVSNVISIDFMFYDCCCFEQDISSWNLQNIKSISSLATFSQETTTMLGTKNILILLLNISLINQFEFKVLLKNDKIPIIPEFINRYL